MHLAFAVPRPAETGGGGGADYMDGLLRALRDLGHQAELSTGPEPAFPAGAIPIVDGMLLPRLKDRLGELVAADAVVVIHHVSAAAGRDPDARDRVHAIEAEMLPRIRRIVATSQSVAARLDTEFGVTATIIAQGARDLPRATPDPADPLILAVGVLTRRKAHDRLLRVLPNLTDLPWRLIIAGDSRREPAHAIELAVLIEELALAHRARILPDPTRDELDRAWQATTVFALATRWEGFPSAVAEALRRGIPVIVSDGSDAAAITPVAAGAIVPGDDMATFGKCLRRVLFDGALRHDMTRAAWQAGQELPSWTVSAQAFTTLLES